MGDVKKNSPMDGAYGGTYCAPMWSKFFAAALKDQPHPSFKTFPWTFSPWKGKMQAMSPSASPSASTSGSPSPGPTKTITPVPQPTKTPTPQPTPTKTKTPKPTPTPTGTPSARPKQVVVGVTTSPTRRSGLPGGSVMTAGAGDSGLAGALVHWVAGVLGL
jgi:membrane peptidoglycan carboxypeptidase